MPPALPIALHVKHEGQSIRFSITGCKVYMAGEFAGNVELSLNCDPALVSIVQQSLHLQVPGEDMGLEFIASGGPDEGVLLCFHSEAIELLNERPESLTFLWCGEQLASVCPDLKDSVPLEDVHQLIDPLEILECTSISYANPICLSVEYDWIWLMPASLFALLALALPFTPLGLPESMTSLSGTASISLALIGAASGSVAFWRPKRQIWCDQNHRELLLVESRARKDEAALVHATRHPSNDYAHVRLCRREYAASLESDDDEGSTHYFVSLEGPIAYAFDDGHVHSRSDALQLGQFAGERSARQFAAEVGYYIGLRILIATDW